ncbi:MAG: hypothetical protein Q7R70_05815, partial [Candidatus Diapherotrites archaeon]|nr:hypothetical protein [Candidatus Diapherotrites archaeon]
RMEAGGDSTFQSPFDAAKALKTLVQYYSIKEARKKAAEKPVAEKAAKPKVEKTLPKKKTKPAKKKR